MDVPMEFGRGASLVGYSGTSRAEPLRSVAVPVGVDEVVGSGHRSICAALGNRLLMISLRTRRAEPQEYFERGHGDTQVVELSNYREDVRYEIERRDHIKHRQKRHPF